MLGVISTLNDMLQEVHGKQSIESKQKILRSFGEFAKQVGSAISNVAPQVGVSSLAVASPIAKSLRSRSWQRCRPR